MDCNDVFNKIPFLIYNEIESDEARPYMEHIHSCHKCSAEWEQYSKVVSFLDRWPDATSPLDPSTVIKQAGKLARIPFKPLWISAAACLILLITLALINVEVRNVEGGLVVTFGRPVVNNTRRVDPIITKIEGRMNNLLNAVSQKFDLEAWKQDKKRMLLAQTMQLQRKEDMNYTETMVRSAVFKSSTDHERAMLIIEGIADVIRNDIPEKLHNGDEP